MVLLHLISSFLHTRSLLVPYAYVSTELIDCIYLSSFEFKAILLASSVKTSCFSLLNRYPTSSFMIFPPISSFVTLITFLFFTFGSGLFNYSFT